MDITGKAKYVTRGGTPPVKTIESELIVPVKNSTAGRYTCVVQAIVKKVFSFNFTRNATIAGDNYVS